MVAVIAAYRISQGDEMFGKTLAALAAGLAGLADTTEPIHIGMVRAVTPTITARQARTTRRFILGNFGLIIVCNLS